MVLSKFFKNAFLSRKLYKKVLIAIDVFCIVSSVWQKIGYCVNVAHVIPENFSAERLARQVY